MSTNDTTDTNGSDNAEKLYVANSARAWGKAPDEYEAVANLASHYRGDIPDEVELSVCCVRGFNGLETSLYSSHIDAEEVLSETKFTIPGDLFETLRDHVSETDILVEECLVEAESEGDRAR